MSMLNMFEVILTLPPQNRSLGSSHTHKCSNRNERKLGFEHFVHEECPPEYAYAFQEVRLGRGRMSRRDESA